MGMRLCLSLTFLGFLNGYSQMGRLPWVDGELPTDKAFYDYRIVRGEGYSLEQSKAKSLESLLIDLATERGVKVSSEVITSAKEEISEKGLESYNQDFNSKTNISFSGYDFSFTKVGEYTEEKKDKYNTWQLYIVSDAEDFQKIEYTSDHGFFPILKSAIVPGWGQISKGKVGKGVLFMAGTATSLGAFLYFNNECNYYLNRLEEEEKSSSLQNKKFWSETVDEFEMYKNLSLGAVGIVWLWNIIDATRKDGKVKYSKRLSYALSNYQNGVALHLKINF